MEHRNEEAEKELLEIAASRPGLIVPHKLLAEIAMDERRPADAAQQYAKLVAILGESKDPSRQPPGAEEELATAHFSLGLALQQTGKLPRPIAHFEQALQIKPDYAEAHLDLGSVLQAEGRLREAIAHYQEALRIKPELALSRSQAGTGGGEAAMPAIERYEQALRTMPDDAGAHRNLANLLRQIGQVPDAIRHCEPALRTKPGDDTIHDNRAVAPTWTVIWRRPRCITPRPSSCKPVFSWP